jgi:NitT/TauT family transport system substrate-binding protein
MNDTGATPDFEDGTLSSAYRGRRDFLKIVGRLGLSAAWTALLEACSVNDTTLGAGGAALETKTIRLADVAAICLAPQYLAEDILKNEGFTDVQYVKGSLGPLTAVANADVDMSITFSGPLIIQVDKGDPITILAGIHAGCFELFGTDQIQAIGDLKGKTVAVLQLGSSQHVFLASMLAYVGLDPRKDINWVTHPSEESIQLLADGKIDAYMAFPPEPQELRAKKIGHVVVNSMMDKPWSQYYCCMLAANRQFMQKNPVATFQALKAILGATDICAIDPSRAARFLVDKGYTANYEYALEAMLQIRYNVWREYDPGDTLRFYGLRLHQVGMISNTPEDIIGRGTDWSFLNRIKAEPNG